LTQICSKSFELEHDDQSSKAEKKCAEALIIWCEFHPSTTIFFVGYGFLASTFHTQKQNYFGEEVK
jgi:hypothetical protein